MDELALTKIEHAINQLSEVIRDLSNQVNPLVRGDQQADEYAVLERCQKEDILLEFILVTGGLINGKILWVGSQGIGVKTDSDQEIILYKHAIAFIQKRGDI